MLSQSDSHSQLADAARAKIRNQLETIATGENVRPSVLASLAGIYAKEGDTAAAIDYYRRALSADYGNISWRLSLARLLGDTGDIEDAIHDCRIILRLKPNYAPAIRLIEKLSTNSNVVSEQ